MAILSNTGSMTLSQFMTEAKYFGKSQEYYDLLKEGFEIDLMSQFLETQEFITESAIDDPEAYGIMMEADEQKTSEVKDKWYNKVGNFFKKIGAAILKALKALASMVKGAIDRWIDNAAYKRIRELAAKINKVFEEHPEYVADTIKNAEAGIKKAIEGFESRKIGDNDPFGGTTFSKRDSDKPVTDLFNKLGNNIKDKEFKKSIRRVVSYTFTDIHVNLPEGLHQLSGYTKDLYTILKAAGNEKKIAEQGKKIEEIISKIKDTNKMHDATTTEVNEKTLRELYKVISKTHDTIEKVVNGENRIINGKNTKDGNKGGYGTNGSELVQLLKEYLTMINNIMEAFRNLVATRHNATGRLTKIMNAIASGLKQVQKGKKDTKEESKSEQKTESFFDDIDIDDDDEFDWNLD